MNVSKIILAFLLTYSGSHCLAAGESKLDLVYKRPIQAADKKAPSQASTMPSQEKALARAGKCTVAISAPKDLRKNKETLGTAGDDNSIVSNQDPTAWLEAALIDLKGHGFNVVPAGAQDAPIAANTAYIKTDLDKLYVWFHSLNIYATLVVTAKINSGSGQAIVKKYRVNGVKLNWWNADGEFVDTLNLAASEWLEKMAEDLDSMCPV